ncbi:CHAT domain-containing protein [Saccharothrix variisporea]|uniref:CHAT domain-containing protein n=1 Tax=Saccharothrix variisporea TaxID=543527 RepID=A0A495X6H6_9PSEU|nr:CHAT domain-containing protein [Saccharothrix variisporea]RKT69497.1 CHAT domain-containing protein [Saccharothrix variisporea]
MLQAIGALMAAFTLVLVGLAPVGRFSSFYIRMAVLGCGMIALQYFATAPELPEHPWIRPTLSVMLILGGTLNLIRNSRLRRRQREDEEFDPDTALESNEVGIGLIGQFDRNGDVRALSLGIERLRLALRASAGESNRTAYAANLVMALRGRYERLRDTADLDEAIAVARTATRTEPEGNPRRSGLLAQLSSALRVRHDHFGDITDLEEALSAGRQAVAAAPNGHPHHALCLSELSAVLVSRYLRTRIPAYLDEAIDAVERAHLATLRDTRRHVRVVHLTTLCRLLVTRYEIAGKPADIERAVDIGRQAVEYMAPGYRLFEVAHNNLALALRVRYERTTEPGDLAEAIDFARRAVDNAATDDPARATHCLNLAMALHMRYLAQRDRTDLVEALALAREATSNPATDVTTRLTAGLSWSDIAASAGEYAEAVEAFELVIEWLPEVAAHELRRTDQEHLLGRWTGIAVTAAACAVSAGEHEKAVTMLEQGRGVLLSRALDVRVDLTDLRARHPELAQEFEELREALDSMYEPSPAFGDEVPNRDWAQRRREVLHWKSVVTRIRSQEGFADFARPPGLPDLLAQTDQGPIVYLNASKYRSDAIILESGRVRVLALPKVSVDVVGDQVRTLAAAVNTLDRQAQNSVLRVLDWVRDALVDPVVGELDLRRDGELPRVWWVPTGPLAMLPIHAPLLDQAISSYVPTVRALLDARKRRVAPSAPSRPLIVSMSTTPGAAPLPNARPEVAAVREVFPRAHVLANWEATRDRVVAELRGRAWTHFACHAIADPESPSRGRLLLHDHESRPFTVLDISRLELRNAELAFLSACETAHPGTLFDEAIHLASAFQLAGFPHVIGTLWPVLDKVAPDFAAAVYRQLAAGTDVAAAVHHATRAVRDRYPNLPALWAGHVHVGS